MDDKKHSINRTDNMTRTPDVSGDVNNPSTQQESNDDTGITPTQLEGIQRSPTGHATSGASTKPFVTGTDSDGQL